MTNEELLKKIDFEKNWLYECGIFGSDVDIAFHAIKKKVIEALDQESVIDKIRAEIEQAAFKDVSGSKYIFVNRINQIIDKYRTESEDK